MTIEIVRRIGLAGFPAFVLVCLAAPGAADDAKAPKIDPASPAAVAEIRTQLTAVTKQLDTTLGALEEAVQGGPEAKATRERFAKEREALSDALHQVRDRMNVMRDQACTRFGFDLTAVLGGTGVDPACSRYVKVYDAYQPNRPKLRRLMIGLRDAAEWLEVDAGRASAVAAVRGLRTDSTELQTALTATLDKLAEIEKSAASDRPAVTEKK